MRRLITGSLVCEVTFAFFQILWIYIISWWMLFCHLGMGIGYSGQSGVCKLDDSQYCDRDNDCKEGDKCNYNEDWGEDEHQEYHCGDLRRYFLSLYVNGGFIILQIIILSIYQCGCFGTVAARRNTNHSSWKYLQWISFISMGCLLWLIITYLIFVINSKISPGDFSWAVWIGLPFYLTTFAFRTTIVFKIHRIFQFNKKINRESVVANCTLVAIESEDREVFNNPTPSAPPLI